MISCIVPTYNNEKTLAHVLDVLLSVKDIDEIVATDDASRDSSRKILEGYKDRCKVIFNDKNLGKGGNLVKGMESSSGDVVLFCDADLANLQPIHIQKMIDTLVRDKADMVIAARIEPDDPHRNSEFLQSVTGERIFYRKAIDDYLDLISRSGNGVEQIVNFAHRDKKVSKIINVGTGHVLKFNRGDFPFWLFDYAKEVGQLAKTEIKLRQHRYKEILKKYLSYVRTN